MHTCAPTAGLAYEAEGPYMTLRGATANETGHGMAWLHGNSSVTLARCAKPHSVTSSRSFLACS